MNANFRSLIPFSWSAFALLCACGSAVDEPTGESHAAIASNYSSWKKETVADVIDIRGVGDSGWAGNHDSDGLGSGFGAALARLDSDKTALRGDLSFINWETVIGPGCNRFHGDAFAFLTLPENIRQAYDHGFNLFGLSNNHTRDCHAIPNSAPSAGSVRNSNDGEAGTLMTAGVLDNFDDRTDIMWAGVAKSNEAKLNPQIVSFQIKGRTIRVAFNSVHLGRENCNYANCNSDRIEVLERLKAAAADLRILSLHCLEFGNLWSKVADVGAAFVRDYDGDVVFGHGPHVAKPVYLVERANGEYGVVFSSLGNFIHPQLSPQSNNAIGRVLLDKDSLKLKEVHLLGLTTSGSSAQITDSPADRIPLIGGTQNWAEYVAVIGNQKVRAAFAKISD